MHLTRFRRTLVFLGAIAGFWISILAPDPQDPASDTATRCTQDAVSATHEPSVDQATLLIARQPGYFVPNLGQWGHTAKFVHRSRTMNVFLEERGWVLDLFDSPAFKPETADRYREDVVSAQKRRGVALRMRFEGSSEVPTMIGEKPLPAHHNFFLGDDESRWRSHVPLYRSIRYGSIYSGIDLRVREAEGIPEYDLLLQAGADLSQVSVRVDGAERLSIAPDGALRIETALGTLTQPAPKTWQVSRNGRVSQISCEFLLRGTDRFGFKADGWDPDTNLTIDPGLVWSTFLGGTGNSDNATAVSLDESGVVTVAGYTNTASFPTSTGAYSRTYLGGAHDAFVTRFDPKLTGAAQLVYSTFLGGTNREWIVAIHVDPGGIVTSAGWTESANFPLTSTAFDSNYSGASEGFVSRLDPNKSGSAQLSYSTFLGGSAIDQIEDLDVDAVGRIAVTGTSSSTDFPTTTGALSTTFQGGLFDGFVASIDPNKAGSGQLEFSTYVGGSSNEFTNAVTIEGTGDITIAGFTTSTNYPTTSSAWSTTSSGGADGFVSRLDPQRTGAAQLAYSTYLGGVDTDSIESLHVEAGVMTVAGRTVSGDFPTTANAFDQTYDGSTDGFVSRLDPSKAAGAQLVFSTYLGGSAFDLVDSISVDLNGVVTGVGSTSSLNFPVTARAHDQTFNGGNADGIVFRLNPSAPAASQVQYASYLGGVDSDFPLDLALDASGTVYVTGYSSSPDFPTVVDAFDRTHNGGREVFVTRIDMGVPLFADLHAVELTNGGAQNLVLDAGSSNANRLYWVFGSVTGTAPGLNLLGIDIPLNPDIYTDVAMAAVNSSVFSNFRGTLDSAGVAHATFNVPANLPVPPGFTFHHAFVVYDAAGAFHLASNAVPLFLR